MERLYWDKITSEKRIPEIKKEQDYRGYRSEMESDYLRIIRSASFRRLQDKTQVFPLDHSDFVRTRLTHSLEVASIAKLIAKQVCEKITDLALEDEAKKPDALTVIETLNCASLLHDIGNPPFGHFGESAIRNWFVKNLDELCFQGKPLSAYLNEAQKYDLYYYEGNAQALRIVLKLHRHVSSYGMHLTSAVMDTIIKYPCNALDKFTEDHKPKAERSLLKKKIGYFQSEKEDSERSLQLLEKGLFDAMRLKEQKEKGFDPYQQAVFEWLSRKQLYCISCVRNAFIDHYEEIMNGTFAQELLTCSSEAALIKALKKFAYEKIYMIAPILKLELMGNEILTFLMDRFMEALIVYDSDTEMSEIQEKYIDLLSRNYLDAYHRSTKNKKAEEKLYERLLLGCDFIVGMTDSYAKRLYQELKGI